MYGCYFAANSDTSRVDAVFNSMHFERITVSDEYIGTPQVACETLKEEIEETQKAIDQLEEDTRSLMARDVYKRQLLCFSVTDSNAPIRICCRG